MESRSSGQQLGDAEPRRAGGDSLRIHDAGASIRRRVPERGLGGGRRAPAAAGARTGKSATDRTRHFGRRAGTPATRGRCSEAPARSDPWSRGLRPRCPQRGQRPRRRRRCRWQWLSATPERRHRDSVRTRLSLLGVGGSPASRRRTSWRSPRSAPQSPWGSVPSLAADRKHADSARYPPAPRGNARRADPRRRRRRAHLHGSAGG